MGIVLFLARFGDDSDETRQSNDVGHLAESVRDALRDRNRFDIDLSVVEDTVVVDLPGGPAEIHADHAIFPIDELDRLTVAVIFASAKAGDFVLLTEGGQYPAILFSASQRTQLPYDDWKGEDVSPLCRSPDELAQLLEGWYRENSEFRARALKAFFDSEERSEAALDSSAQVENRAGTNSTGREKGVTEKGVTQYVTQHECIWLYRFDPEANERPKHPSVLQDLREVCQRFLNEHGGEGDLIDDREWPPLVFGMLGYCADIWPGLVEFNFHEASPPSAEFMFRLARAGDFSVVVPGVVLLTDEGQRARLPETWKEWRVVLCSAPEELQQGLHKLWLSIPRPKRKYPANVSIPGALPGSARVVYIEATAKETPVQHQKKVYKHWRQGEGAPPLEKCGMARARFWQLTTPAGRRFYAYSYGGVGWLLLFRHFAESSNRNVGFIVNFETFVEEDNQRFPLSACQVQNVEP